MIHRTILHAILVCLIMALTGCWDQIELEKRAIIVAIGVDKADKPGEIMLTLQSVITSKLTLPIYGQESEQNRVARVVSTNGKTISEAIRNYKQQTNNRPYLQQNRLLIIGEDLARDGVEPIIDFFIRSPESKTRAWVLISRGKASEILKWQSEARRIPADFVKEMIDSRNTITPMVAEDIHHFILKLSNQNTSPTTSGIEIVRKMADQPPEVRIFGTAVFKKDKFAGWLNIQETNGLLWIIGEYGNGIFETSYTGIPNHNIALQITRSSAKVDPESTSGRILIKLVITVDGTLGEQSGGIKLTDKKTIQSLEKKVAAEINREIRATLNRCQKDFNSDVFGFSEAIERKFPQRRKELHRRWTEEFPLLQIKLTTSVKIKATGIIMDPINLK